MAAEVISIDSLISKAEHDKHAKTAKRANLAIHNFTYGQLVKYYKKSLSEADKAKLEAVKDDQEKELDLIDKFAEKDGKLPYEHADAFVKDVAYAILRKVNKTAAKDMKEQLALLKKKDSTADQRAEALQKIRQYMGMTQQYGIDLDKLKTEGIKNGFNSDLIGTHFQHFEKVYHANLSHSYLDQIEEKDLDKHLPKIKETKGADGKVIEAFDKFAIEAAKKAPYEEKRELVVNHKNAVKRLDKGGVETFLDNYKNRYFAAAEEKKAA